MLLKLRDEVMSMLEQLESSNTRLAVALREGNKDAYAATSLLLRADLLDALSRIKLHAHATKTALLFCGAFGNDEHPIMQTVSNIHEVLRQCCWFWLAEGSNTWGQSWHHSETEDVAQAVVSLPLFVLGVMDKITRAMAFLLASTEDNPYRVPDVLFATGHRCMSYHPCWLPPTPVHQLPSVMFIEICNGTAICYSPIEKDLCIRIDVSVKRGTYRPTQGALALLSDSEPFPLLHTHLLPHVCTCCNKDEMRISHYEITETTNTSGGFDFAEWCADTFHPNLDAKSTHTHKPDQDIGFWFPSAMFIRTYVFDQIHRTDMEHRLFGSCAYPTHGYPMLLKADDSRNPDLDASLDDKDIVPCRNFISGLAYHISGLDKIGKFMGARNEQGFAGMVSRRYPSSAEPQINWSLDFPLIIPKPARVRTLDWENTLPVVPMMMVHNGLGASPSHSSWHRMQSTAEALSLICDAPVFCRFISAEALRRIILDHVAGTEIYVHQLYREYAIPNASEIRDYVDRVLSGRQLAITWCRDTEADSLPIGPVVLVSGEPEEISCSLYISEQPETHTHTFLYMHTHASILPMTAMRCAFVSNNKSLTSQRLCVGYNNSFLLKAQNTLYWGTFDEAEGYVPTLNGAVRIPNSYTGTHVNTYTHDECAVFIAPLTHDGRRYLIFYEQALLICEAFGDTFWNSHMTLSSVELPNPNPDPKSVARKCGIKDVSVSEDRVSIGLTTGLVVQFHVAPAISHSPAWEMTSTPNLNPWSSTLDGWEGGMLVSPARLIAPLPCTAVYTVSIALFDYSLRLLVCLVLVHKDMRMFIHPYNQHSPTALGSDLGGSPSVTMNTAPESQQEHGIATQLWSNVARFPASVFESMHGACSHPLLPLLLVWWANVLCIFDITTLPVELLEGQAPLTSPFASEYDVTHLALYRTAFLEPIRMAAFSTRNLEMMVSVMLESWSLSLDLGPVLESTSAPETFMQNKPIQTKDDSECTENVEPQLHTSPNLNPEHRLGRKNKNRRPKSGSGVRSTPNPHHNPESSFEFLPPLRPSCYDDKL